MYTDPKGVERHDYLLGRIPGADYRDAVAQCEQQGTSIRQALLATIAGLAESHRKTAKRPARRTAKGKGKV